MPLQPSKDPIEELERIIEIPNKVVFSFVSCVKIITNTKLMCQSENAKELKNQKGDSGRTFRRKFPSRKFLSRHSWKRSVTTIDVVAMKKRKLQRRDRGKGRKR